MKKLFLKSIIPKSRTCIMLSPTSINTYVQCPRSYYLKYIKKMPQPVSKHMKRGTIVHEIIEDLFKKKGPFGLKPFVTTELERRWSMKGARDITPEEEPAFKAETLQMLLSFVDLIDIKITNLLCEGGICKDKFHAWNIIKPRMQEEAIKIPEIALQGKIDAIHEYEDETGEKQIFIIDYKTSKLWRYAVSNDYILQGKIYALLYKRKYGRMPTHVGFNYIRYGEIMNFFFTEEQINETELYVQDIRKKTLSMNLADYPCFCDKNRYKADMCTMYEIREDGNVYKKTKVEKDGNGENSSETIEPEPSRT